MRSLVKNIKNVIFLTKNYWKYGKLYIVISLIISVFVIPASTLANILYTQTIIDSVVAGAAFEEVLMTIFLFIIILVGAIVIQSIFNTYGEPVVVKIHQKINKEIYDKALKTDYKYYDDPDFYDNYTWAINEFAAKSEEAKNLFINVCHSISTVISMLAVILLLGPWIVVITILQLVLVTNIEMKRNKIYINRQEKIMPLDRKLNYVQRISYQREYAADLKSTNLSGFINGIYDTSGDGKISIIKNFRRSIIMWLSVQNFLAIFYNALIMGYIAYSIIVSKTIIGVGKFAGLLAANNQLFASLNGFFGFFSQAANISLYVEKIKPFFEARSPIETDSPGSDSKREYAPEGLLDICFKNVSFSYANSDFSLKDVNLLINAGEKIAIVGENGVGKTTLVKLLLRLYDVTKGEILVNGIPIDQYDVKSLRSKIGVAFQNSNIYAISLADNLQMYGSADNEKLAEIIEKISLGGVLEKSNADITTELTKEFSNEGIMLSVGEIQKIALGRILLKDFGLLLLDEPSSALDPIAEYELMKMIYDKSNMGTSIIIAHRLSTVRDADRIYVMDDGSVIEAGNHDELIKSKGKYYEMFSKQSENYIK